MTLGDFGVKWTTLEEEKTEVVFGTERTELNLQVKPTKNLWCFSWEMEREKVGPSGHPLV